MKELIVTKNLVKEYGKISKVRALDKVNLSIKEGEFIGIMGPSGSGKSTLLNLLATIDYPTKGEVFINGKDTKIIFDSELAKLRYENMGFIFQDFNLIDSLTLRENIGLPLTLANKKKSEVDKKVNELAELLEIKDTLDKYPIECSGGQRQRAASARALISEPKIIIADEPTGNLDTKNSHSLLEFFKKINETKGTTIVLVTHDSMIASYSDKLIFLKDGKIEETIEKNEKSQSEFFYSIIEVTSRENQNLFKVMNK